MDPALVDKLSQILDLVKDPLQAFTISAENKERLLALLKQGDKQALEEIEEIYKDVPEPTRNVLMRNIKLLIQLQAVCTTFNA